MKTAITLLAILLTASVCGASPWLVCDPQTGVDYYTVDGLAAPLDGTHIVPDATGKYGFRFDLANLIPGTYNLTAHACSNLWGCGAASLPLAFTRPTLPIPVNLGINPSP